MDSAPAGPGLPLLSTVDNFGIPDAQECLWLNSYPNYLLPAARLKTALTADGYRPVAVTVAAPNDSPQWTGLYEKKSMRGAWQAKSWLTLSEFNQEWESTEARGQYPIYLSITQYQGQTRISTIWDTDPGWVETRPGLTAEQLAEKVTMHYQRGYKLLAVAGWELGGSARFAATWSR